MTFYTDDLASKVIGEVNATLDATRTGSLLDRIIARPSGGASTQTSFAGARDVNRSNVTTAYEGGMLSLSVYNLGDSSGTAISRPVLIIDTDGDVSAYRTAASTDLTGVSGDYTWRGVQVHGARTSKFQISASLAPLANRFSLRNSFTYVTLEQSSAGFLLSGSGRIDLDTGMLSSTNMAYTSTSGGDSKSSGKLRGQVAGTSDAGATFATDSVVGLFAFSDGANGGFIGSSKPQLERDDFAVVQNVEIDGEYRAVTFRSQDFDNVIAQSISGSYATRQASLVHSSFRKAITQVADNVRSPITRLPIATHGAANLVEKRSGTGTDHNATAVRLDGYKVGSHAALVHGVTTEFTDDTNASPVSVPTIDEFGNPVYDVDGNPVVDARFASFSTYFTAYTISDFTPLPVGNYKWSGVQVGPKSDPNSDDTGKFEIEADLTAGNNSFAYSTITEAVSGEATLFTLTGNGVVDTTTGVLTSSTMNFNDQASGASSELRGQIAGNGEAVTIGFIGSKYTPFTQRTFVTTAYEGDLDDSGDGTYGAAWGQRHFKETAITPQPTSEREVIYISQNIAEDVSATGKDVQWIRTALSTDLTADPLRTDGTDTSLTGSTGFTGTGVIAYRTRNEADKATVYFIDNGDADRLLVDGPAYDPFYLKSVAGKLNAKKYNVRMSLPRLASTIGTIGHTLDESWTRLEFQLKHRPGGRHELSVISGGLTLENALVTTSTGRFIADIAKLTSGGDDNVVLENGGKLIGQILGSQALTLGGVYWGTAPATTSASIVQLPTAARSVANGGEGQCSGWRVRRRSGPPNDWGL